MGIDGLYGALKRKGQEGQETAPQSLDNAYFEVTS